MMNYQLTIPAILRRAEQIFGYKKIVTRMPDKSFHEYTYADFARRSKQLALALQKLGVKSGERVATFCWNHYRHLEAYYAVPSCGAVLHTLNIRLFPEDLTFIANDAMDKVVIVDKVIWPLFEKFKDNIQAQIIIVITDDGTVPDGTLDYEKLLEAEDESHFDYPDFDENQAAAMCYTSGTTGKPKGVLYSHRAIVLHSMGAALPDVMGLGEAETVLPVVPMFHANAWGLPYTATMVGCTQVYPGPHLDAVSLLEDFEQHKVTLTAGVPTIWLGIIQYLEQNPTQFKLVHNMKMIVGGSAAPEGMIRNFDKFNLKVVHAWGMTEMTPLGTMANLLSDMADSSEDEKYAYRASQGIPSPMVEIRARGDEGMVPWDGKTMGELEVRGPWIAASYYNAPHAGDRFTDDGWFRTGDIVTIDRRGTMKIQDRSKDLIKSGGEWISSVDLENTIMAHPAVAEAAVISIFDPKWAERPLAVVVRKQGQNVTAEEIREFLSTRVAKWWLPDAIEFVEAIPRTATGKFLKTALREQFKDYQATAS
jgi:fatty-acyl-CoA synthase